MRLWRGSFNRCLVPGAVHCCSRGVGSGEPRASSAQRRRESSLSDACFWEQRLFIRFFPDLPPLPFPFAACAPLAFNPNSEIAEKKHFHAEARGARRTF